MKEQNINDFYQEARREFEGILEDATPLDEFFQSTHEEVINDQILSSLLCVLEGGYYDYDIKLRVNGGATNDAFRAELAQLIARTRGIEYDVKCEAKFNPVRTDNQPF